MVRDSILIKSCKDSQLWYNYYIGCVFEVIEYDALTKVYWVAAITGRNVVYEEDCDAWELVLTKQTQPEDTDPVEKPKHYQLREGYEVYDLRQDLAKQAQTYNIPHNQYSDWDRALEYLLRMWGKNKLEDAKKAQWYLKKLIEKIEETDK